MENKKDTAYLKSDGFKSEKRLNLNTLLDKLRIEEKRRKKLNLISTFITIIIILAATFIYLI